MQRHGSELLARSPLGRHGLLVALTGIFAINAIDRQVLGILQEDIKQELLLTDSQLGLLSGFAFVAVYILMGIPMAYLADRKSRTKLLATAMTFWSLMTVLCGLAQSYIQLVFARFGVGAGESACSPTAHSMLADRYDTSIRATALSVYGTGFFIGTSIGLALGGWLADHVGWRYTFFIVGAPGILAAGLVWFFMREPERAIVSDSGLKQFSTQIFALWFLKSFRCYLAGISLAMFSLGGLMTWLPSLILREFSITKTELGLKIGIINGLGGVIGAVGMGILADRLSRKDRRWNLRLSAVLLAVSFPAAAIAFSSSSLEMTLFFYAIPVVLVSGITAPILSLSQQIVPSNYYAMITATILFATNLFAFGFSPLIIGFASDFLSPTMGEAEALRKAMLCLSFVFVIAAAFILYAIRHVPKDGLLLDANGAKLLKGA